MQRRPPCWLLALRSLLHVVRCAFANVIAATADPMSLVRARQRRHSHVASWGREDDQGARAARRGRQGGGIPFPLRFPSLPSRAYSLLYSLLLVRTHIDAHTRAHTHWRYIFVEEVLTLAAKLVDCRRCSLHAATCVIAVSAWDRFRCSLALA